jgi:hypothetical protein
VKDPERRRGRHPLTVDRPGLPGPVRNVTSVKAG